MNTPKQDELCLKICLTECKRQAQIEGYKLMKYMPSQIILSCCN